MTTEVERAYLAGLLDGEGTITIMKVRIRGGYEHYVANVEISNTDIRMIQWLLSTVGGNICLSNKKRTLLGKWRPLYRISYRGRSVGKVLDLALPYLRLKTRQAELVLELRSRFGKTGTRPIPEEECQYRTLLYEECKKLNLRGTGDAERLSEKALEEIRAMRQSELAGNEPREGEPKSLPASV